MYLGEICLFTEDVRRLAAFYKALLQVDNHSCDEGFQAIVESEPMLTVLHKPGLGSAAGRAALAFTVEDVEAACAHAHRIGARVLAGPTRQPWGTVNMILADPDGNQLYLRQLAAPKERI